jgi:hypothetical protein
MSKLYREIWLQCPPQIITDLAIPSTTFIVAGGANWIRFNLGEAGYTVIYNNYAESTIGGSFRGSVSRPVLRQKKLELAVRESRYIIGLSIQRIAQLSDSSFLSNQPTQLVTIRDYVQPEYADMVASLVGQTNPYTARVGYIPTSSVNLPTNLEFCNERDLAGAGEIKFQFVESSPSI